MPDDKPRQPDLDLIQMVQRARMQHDADARPSQTAGVYWIEAKCEQPDCAPPTPRAGQWVYDTTAAEVDALWDTVKAATRAGQLGYKSKVSTASRQQGQPGSRTICARTADSDDAADVERIRAGLVDLGLGDRLRYERDHAV
jgi:hypothetical protein